MDLLEEFIMIFITILQLLAGLILWLAALLAAAGGR